MNLHIVGIARRTMLDNRTCRRNVGARGLL
jgi:hypothetical protein